MTCEDVMKIVTGFLGGMVGGSIAVLIALRLKRCRRNEGDDHE